MNSGTGPSSRSKEVTLANDTFEVAFGLCPSSVDYALHSYREPTEPPVAGTSYRQRCSKKGLPWWTLCINVAFSLSAQTSAVDPGITRPYLTS